ncbi:SET and MYND domain-containing protein 4-like [Bradysia coprophila]|uniref:SET and MYND domain-containing protein 4-like n=1 Tax=Bradysia coprophila TaxID=38358 RepID=UPI00187D88A4|nr:SET and MYND domain-containing protein 4-like [Bradysia coprophila]
MNLLWKKETNELGSAFVDITKKVRSNSAITSRIAAEEKEFSKKLSESTKIKTNRLSVTYRENGNSKFKQQNWMEAMELYNQSLCYAEIGSENVSMAYGNRSACFYHMQMYRKCLQDIALAKEAKYPERLMAKLDKRETDCLKLMTVVGQEEEFVANLSFEADANFSGMANVLQIQRNDTFGRYITANQDIDVGKTVLVEEAFMLSASTTRSKVCHTCAKTSMNFIACDQCTYAMFCSVECMQSNNFHKIECQCHGFQYLDLPIQHLLRTIFLALQMFPSVDDLMEFVQNTVAGASGLVPANVTDLKSKYRSILKLNVFMTSLHRQCFLPEICKLYSSLMCFPLMKQQFTTIQKQRFLLHLLGHHICVINSNAFSNHGDQYFTFIIQSYFNHSCIPNLVRFECGNKTICTTTRPVKKGDQLFVFYLGYEMKDRQSKANFLQENFGFRCKCEKCVISDWHPIMPLADPEFQHILRQYRHNEQAIVNNQNKQLRSELISAGIKFLRKYGAEPSKFEIGPIEEIFGKLLEIQANGRLLY